MTRELTPAAQAALGRAPTEIALNDPAMLAARILVEDHIAVWGMVPHPDKLKEAIAAALIRAWGPR